MSLSLLAKGLSILSNILPATTFTGNINLGTNKIKFSDITLFRDGPYFKVMNLAEDDCMPVYASAVFLSAALTAVSMQSQGGAIHTGGADGYYARLMALDSGTTWAEVARWMSAADPYFHIGSGSGATSYGVAIRTVSYNFVHGSTLFDADGLTDSANVWNQPAGSVLLGVKMILNEQFAGSDPAALTDLDVTVGLVGDQDGLLIPTMNGLSDAVGTAYTTRGAYWDTSAEGCFWYANAEHNGLLMQLQWDAMSTTFQQEI